MEEDFLESTGLDFLICLTENSLSLPDLHTTQCSNLSNTRSHSPEQAHQPGSEEFRRARKRRQNRESAARNRARKRIEEVDLEIQLQLLTRQNESLRKENASLKAENEALKRDKGENGMHRKRGRRGKWVRAGLYLTLMLVVLCFSCDFDAVRPVPPTEGLRLLRLPSSSTPRSVFLPMSLLCLGLFVIWSQTGRRTRLLAPN